MGQSAATAKEPLGGDMRGWTTNAVRTAIAAGSVSDTEWTLDSESEEKAVGRTEYSSMDMNGLHPLAGLDRPSPLSSAQVRSSQRPASLFSPNHSSFRFRR